MATTYTLIASTTVGSGGISTIDFTSIPNTYTDLCLKLTARTTRPTDVWGTVRISFNTVSTNLSSRLLQGDGATTASYTYGTSIPFDLVGQGATANTFGSAEFYIPNYAGSTNKSLSIDGVGENNGTTAYANLSAGLWSSTAAITAIKLDAGIYSFAQYSTAYLYGVKSA